jgi:DNA-binding transcriptional regulator YhcF (GntR family)
LLDLPISRSELANLVGIALATASRLCKELKDEGVIRTRGRQMFIVGWGKLEEDDG